MNRAIEINNLSVKIENQPIIQSVSFDLKEGEIGCLLGASGCGKSTLLRAIAGFERPAAGEIRVKGVRVSNARHLVPVEQRQIGMVFQDYALFPHMTAVENITFGMRNASKQTKRERLLELIELLDLEGCGDKYPHQLSGGQQQRIALARAMAPRPAILLLDEPFSNLDVELREQIAYQIGAILRKDGVTALLVSHNQLEAFAMADRVGVINHGSLLQWDTAFNLYHEPKCVYVADFVGEGVFIGGEVVDAHTVDTELGHIVGKRAHGRPPGSRVNVLIRPDDVLHDDASPMQAKVLKKAFRGAEFLYTLEYNGGTRLLSLVPSHHNHPVNEPIGIRLEIDHLVVF